MNKKIRNMDKQTDRQIKDRRGNKKLSNTQRGIQLKVEIYTHLYMTE